MKKAPKETPAAPVKDKLEVSATSSTDTDTATVKKAPIEKQTKKAKTAAKQKPASPKKGTHKKSYRSFVSSFIFLMVLAATGLAAYDFWLLRAQAPVNAQLINVQGSFETRIAQLEQQLQATKNQLSTEQRASESAQSERAAINSALQGISEKLGRSTVAWRMAEVEYLLTVANHRLTLAQDRQTAIAVFETADSRLKAIADPSLLKVRKTIASEISALRAVPNVDIPGIAVQTGSLAEGVEQLPLLDKKRLAVATEKQQRVSALEWRELPAAVWKDIKSLVQVRRHQQPTEPLLPPKQAWFLYQNLQLKLEQARLAVLQKNTTLFRQSLKEVSHWLDSYFDVESPAVINMQATVKKLADVELQPSVPDVSGSLRELRSVMNARSAIQVSLADKSVTKKATAP